MHKNINLMYKFKLLQMITITYTPLIKTSFYDYKLSDTSLYHNHYIIDTDKIVYTPRILLSKLTQFTELLYSFVLSSQSSKYQQTDELYFEAIQFVLYHLKLYNLYKESLKLTLDSEIVEVTKQQYIKTI